MIKLLMGFILGILTTLVLIYIKDFVNEFMFMKYHNEHPTPEQVMEISGALIDHQNKNECKNHEFCDNGETENSYQ